ncbi:MAG TPA: trypsin-like peptidase domain-containing protein, partial [Planctomycetaceae bacterium]|nr:trypsin-like peptidase domain-containing protein [Planctomycetaceae bacterium]
MKAQFKVLTGARAGQTEVHSANEFSVGRHASCDMRFHPDDDLDVSTRHALIARSGSGWVVRDLQSRNGTYVNGHRINGDTKLSETDQVRFGLNGPTIEFRTVPDSVIDTPKAVFTSAAGAPLRPSSGFRPTPASAATGPARATAGSTTQRIRVEVARQTKKMRAVTMLLILVLLLAVGGFYAYNRTEGIRRAAEVAAVKSSTDEALRAVKEQLADITAALQRSQGEVKGLQEELAAAKSSGNRSQIAELSRRLDEASFTLRHQQAAAQVDYRSINAANQRSIAIIYVKFADDSVFTGTAFAVRREGLLVTNRHVVAGEDGTRRAVDLAIRFADSPQVFKATVVKLAPDADLAVVKVENLLGAVPTIRGVNNKPESVQAGDPVALIGFPLGVELPMGSEAGREVAKTSFGAGAVSKVLPERLQIDGYSAQGASGSPIF